jgi:hypothetical protein
MLAWGFVAWLLARAAPGVAVAIPAGTVIALL